MHTITRAQGLRAVSALTAATLIGVLTGVDLLLAAAFWNAGVFWIGWHALRRPGERFRHFVVRACFTDRFYDAVQHGRRG